VNISPVQPEAMKEILSEHPLCSFWGHPGTLGCVNAAFGADLTPLSARPALSLTPDLLPMLEGIAFAQCWVISPDYQPGFRPALGEEVPEAMILGWQGLKIEWI